MDCGLTGLTFVEPSLCRVEFAADCDLHTIVQRFMVTGVLPPSRDGASGDFTHCPQTFDDLQQFHASARQEFEQLPEVERFKYGDDYEVWFDQVKMAQLEMEFTRSDISKSENGGHGDEPKSLVEVPSSVSDSPSKASEKPQSKDG